MGPNNKSKCRTCLKQSSVLKLLNTKPKMLNINKTYMEMLKLVVVNIEIGDGDSKKTTGICSTCCKKIRDSYTFIKQVRRCNKHFLLDSTKVEFPDEFPKPLKSENAPEIKQEFEKLEEPLLEPPPKQELDDTCTSASNDNFDAFAEVNDTDTQDTQDETITRNLFPEVTIKTESDQKTDLSNLLPVCILTETPFEDEENSNADSDSCKQPESSSESSTYDPLDNNEVNDEEKPVESVDDKLLPVRCDECERVFPNSIQLNRHKRDTHIPDELKIQCPHCPVKFSRRYNMYAHMRSFHKAETVRKHQVQPRKLEKTEICDMCKRGYSDKYKLKAHIKSKHGPESKPKKEKLPPRRFLCTLCGLTCSSQSNLDIHYRRHTGEKPFKCDFCGRAYARLYDVQVHRRVHTGETPFKCTICEKAFKRSNKLKIHMRTHTNERPYKCTQCEKAFKQSKDLNIHKRTHTGERPYKCNVCQSTFTQSNSLRLHQTKTKHFEPVIQETDSFTDITNTLP